MAGTGPGFERIRRLADDVHAKIVAKEALIREARGRIAVRIFPNRGTPDIRIAARRSSNPSSTRLGTEHVRHLAQQVRALILESPTLIAEAVGEITIECFMEGVAPQAELNATTR